MLLREAQLVEFSPASGFARQAALPARGSYIYYLCFIPQPYSPLGDQALEILQYLFSNDLDVPVGHIVHTGMLNGVAECSDLQHSPAEQAGEPGAPPLPPHLGPR